MKTQEKAKVKFSRNRVFRVVATVAPNQGEVELDNHGFTLVELIVVMAIIAILATMAIPAYSEMRLKAKNMNAKSDIRTLELAINAYIIDQNKLPDQLTDIGTQANIKDPWGRSYQYYNIRTGTGDGSRYKCWNAAEPNLNDDFDLYSFGQDGKTAYLIPDPTDPAPSDSKDDIVRAGTTVEYASEF